MPYEISSHASSTSLSTAPDELAYYSNNSGKNQDFPVKNQLNTAMTQKLISVSTVSKEHTPEAITFSFSFLLRLGAR